MGYISVALTLFGCLILAFTAGYVIAKIEEVSKHGK